MIDKAMAKRGYKKMKENEYGCYYKKHDRVGFEHIVAIVHKANGRHIMQSYEEDVLNVEGRYINEVCGVEIPVLLLMWLKAWKLKIKYKWR